MSEWYLARLCGYSVYEQCYIDEVMKFSSSKHVLHYVIDWRLWFFLLTFSFPLLLFFFCYILVFGYCIIKDHTVEPSAGVFMDIMHGVSRKVGHAGMLIFLLF